MKAWVIGEYSKSVLMALNSAVDKGLLEDYVNDDNIPEHLIQHKENWIVVKGKIHTDDFLRKVIATGKIINNGKKFFLSHCACFCDTSASNTSFVLTDAACVPFPTAEQRKVILDNAIDFYSFLWGKPKEDCHISIISAGGDSNRSADPELYDWWQKQKNNYSHLRLEQLDVALNKRIRDEKKVDGELADVIMVKDINVGNAIWKSLTALNDTWTCAGNLMGLGIPVVLNSRGDNHWAVLDSIRIAVKNGEK